VKNHLTASLHTLIRVLLITMELHRDALQPGCFSIATLLRHVAVSSQVNDIVSAPLHKYHSALRLSISLRFSVGLYKAAAQHSTRAAAGACFIFLSLDVNFVSFVTLYFHVLLIHVFQIEIVFVRINVF